LLDEAIEHGFAFCREKGIRLEEILAKEDVFKKLGRFNECADVLLKNDEWRKSFNVYENTISSLYEACRPEVLSLGKGRVVAAFEYLRGVVDSIVGETDISKVEQRVSELLDESLVVDQSRIGELPTGQHRRIRQGRQWDLSRIDFEQLKHDFQEATYKNIEIADLRAFIEHKLNEMMSKNVTRADFAQRLQQIIDRYNAGGSSTDNYFDDLMRFTREWRDEDERHVREGLTEDELELFDLLKKDGMTQAETQKVRLAAKALLHRLLEEHPKVLVQDWYKDNQSQKVVRSAVETVLDSNLPDSYDRILFKTKCDNIVDLMVDHASHGRKWAA
jgi:type I restriction enzyme, R subunit